MTARFCEHGIAFMYPENWTVESPEEPGWPFTVSAHSPDGAFWQLTADRATNTDLLDQVVAAIQQQYEGVELSPVTREIGDERFDGIELNFYVLDFVVTAVALNCSTADNARVLMFQAESRDFDKLAGVFDAMSLSLFHSDAAGSGETAAI